MIRNGVLTALTTALTLAAAMPLHAQEANAYAWVHIAQGWLGDGVTLPADYHRALGKHLHAELQQTLGTLTVIPADADPPADTPGIRLTWTILKFTPGDSEKRRRIGLGFGTTKIVARYTFADARTGAVLLQGVADGKVVGGWIDGGDSLSATRGLAKEIAAKAGKRWTKDKGRRTKDEGRADSYELRVTSYEDEITRIRARGQGRRTRTSYELRVTSTRFTRVRS